MPSIDRRKFLKQGASIAGAFAGVHLLGASGTAAARDPRPADLRELAGALKGKVILPHSRDYRAARLVWNSRFDYARPAAVVRAADAADAQTVVDFARAHGRRLIVRGGGHSFAGYSTGDGLVLDLSALTSVKFGSHGEVARLGAGGTTLSTYRGLWRRKMAISGGTCPTVGISGLTCGGGLGVLSRRHGLTSDNLRAVEMVTANGRLVRASRNENADLFWATQGGGGGNFGIITALTFALVPVDMPFTHLEYQFPWTAAEDVVAAWQDWLPGSPHKTWSAVELTTQAPGARVSPVIAIEVVHAGPERDARAAVAELLDAVGVAPTSQSSDSGPFFDTEYSFYCKGLRPKECTLAEKSAAGAYPRSALYSKSDVASGPWARAGLSKLTEWIEKRQRDRTLTPHNFSPAHTIGKVLIEAADGAVNSIRPDATAFVHRNNLFVAQYQARWRTGSPREVVEANLEWADGLYAAIKPYRSGAAYQNYIDADLGNWQHAYYGANLARLRKVKSKYDSHNFFRFAQSIPPR